MTRASASCVLALCVFTCALLGACAAPGDPTARHPVVPVPITDLSARQSGNDVVLTFTVPTRSMDRETLAEAPTIEIYRAALTPGATPDRKTTWRLVYTIPSERVDSYAKDNRFEFRDIFSPDDLSKLAGTTMAYMVRSRAAKTKGSDDSNFLGLTVFPPPEAPRDLKIAVTEPALNLSWAPSPLPAGTSSVNYRVYRAEADTGQEAAAPQGASQEKLKSPPESIGQTTATEFSDPHFEFGKTYAYTVRSMAQFGVNSVESIDSETLMVAPRDTFPPAAPSGLEIAVIPATSQAPSYVELSWAISPESDLAGYAVYRSDNEDMPGERINSEILPSPAFRDTSIVSGKRYFYRVSAVDRAGNESPKSSAVQTEVP